MYCTPITDIIFYTLPTLMSHDDNTLPNNLESIL